MYTPKQRLTLFNMGETIPIAVGRQIIIDELYPKHVEHYVVHDAGKRKRYVVNMQGECLAVFDGHTVPFCTQYDASRRNKRSSFVMDAAWHWIGNQDVIREYLLSKNLNPNFDPRGHRMYVEEEGKAEVELSFVTVPA